MMNLIKQNQVKWKLSQFESPFKKDKINQNQIISVQHKQQNCIERQQILEPINFHIQQNQEAKVKEQQSQQILYQHDIYKDQSNFTSSSSQSSSEEQNLIKGHNKRKRQKRKTSTNDTYRKYSRITPEIKQRLIFFVARQNMSIKDASIKLKINYSSAKFIFSQYRDRKLQIIDREIDVNQSIGNQIIITKIEQNDGFSLNDEHKVLIKCSSGGKFEAESQKIYNLQDILKMYTDPLYLNSQKQKVELIK